MHMQNQFYIYLFVLSLKKIISPDSLEKKEKDKKSTHSKPSFGFFKKQKKVKEKNSDKWQNESKLIEFEAESPIPIKTHNITGSNKITEKKENDLSFLETKPITYIEKNDLSFLDEIPNSNKKKFSQPLIDEINLPKINIPIVPAIEIDKISPIQKDLYAPVMKVEKGQEYIPINIQPNKFPKDLQSERQKKELFNFDFGKWLPGAMEKKNENEKNKTEKSFDPPYEDAIEIIEKSTIPTIDLKTITQQSEDLSKSTMKWTKGPEYTMFDPSKKIKTDKVKKEETNISISNKSLINITEKLEENPQHIPNKLFLNIGKNIHIASKNENHMTKKIINTKNIAADYFKKLGNDVHELYLKHDIIIKNRQKNYNENKKQIQVEYNEEIERLKRSKDKDIQKLYIKHNDIKERDESEYVYEVIMLAKKFKMFVELNYDRYNISNFKRKLQDIDYQNDILAENKHKISTEKHYSRKTIDGVIERITLYIDRMKNYKEDTHNHPYDKLYKIMIINAKKCANSKTMKYNDVGFYYCGLFRNNVLNSDTCRSLRDNFKLFSLKDMITIKTYEEK